MGMALKPQDILVALKLSMCQQEWSYSTLATALGLSVGEAHNSIQRLTRSRLYNESTRAPVRAALEEFLIHGVKYAFPPECKGMTRGVPTAWAASPLKEQLVDTNEPPPVWPHPEGSVRGYEFVPLYPTVPDVALRDLQLYEALALLDSVRAGSAREHNLAVELLRARLKSKAQVVTA
jgi:hypothetical protein